MRSAFLSRAVCRMCVTWRTWSGGARASPAVSARGQQNRRRAPNPVNRGLRLLLRRPGSPAP